MPEENVATSSEQTTEAAPFSILETDNWLTDKPVTKTEKVDEPILENTEEETPAPLDPENKIKEEEAKKKAEQDQADKDALIAKAKEYGLPETATKEEVEKAELAKKEEKPEFEFKVPGTQTAEEGTYKALAISRGLEVPEDFSEEKGLDIIFQLEEAKHKAEIDKVKAENIISKYKPEVAVKLEMLESGISEEEIFTPTRKIDEILAKTPLEKVRFAIEQTPGITKELVDKEMELLAEKPEEIEHKAKMVDLTLTAQKEAIENNLTQRLTEFKERKQQEFADAIERDAKELEMTLSSMTEYRGQPVKADVAKYLINNWRSGKYDTAFKDSKVIAEFLMQLEFGKDLDKHYKESILSNAKKNLAKSLHNTPDALTPKSGTVTKNNTPTEKFGLIDKAFG